MFTYIEIERDIDIYIYICDLAVYLVRLRGVEAESGEDLDTTGGLDHVYKLVFACFVSLRTSRVVNVCRC